MDKASVFTQLTDWPRAWYLGLKNSRASSYIRDMFGIWSLKVLSKTFIYIFCTEKKTPFMLGLVNQRDNISLHEKRQRFPFSEHWFDENELQNQRISVPKQVQSSFTKWYRRKLYNRPKPKQEPKTALGNAFVLLKYM